MTTDNFCFYLQYRLSQTSQTGGQWYSDTPPLVFPGSASDRSQKYVTSISEKLTSKGDGRKLTKRTDDKDSLNFLKSEKHFSNRS